MAPHLQLAMWLHRRAAAAAAWTLTAAAALLGSRVVHGQLLPCTLWQCQHLPAGSIALCAAQLVSIAHDIVDDSKHESCS